MLINDNGIISLSNEVAECKISLFGANLLSYRPKGEEYDVFWLGDLNKFDNVQAIRGGIPVCWPRFAAEKLNDYLPRHGFARLSTWQLNKVEVDSKKIEVELFLLPDAKFNVNLSATLKLKITDKLEYNLETINHGTEDFDFSEALHAYFNIGNINDMEVKGVKGHQYKSSLDGNIYNLEQNLKINGEFDAAFLQHTSPIDIVDPILNRVISVEKSGSNTTVIWNPAKDLAEMSPEQYKNFVCIEPANQGDAYVHLKAGAKHTISMVVQTKKLK